MTNSSSNTLDGVPAGSSIRVAYLYWAGSWDGAAGTLDSNVTFQGSPISAARTFTETFVAGGSSYPYFSGFADVTPLVSGNGTYTFADLTVHTGAPHCGSSAVLSGWALIVVYENAAEPLRVVNLYDGFRFYRGSQISITDNNFLVPAAPINGRHGHVTWEGDVGNSAPLGGFVEALQFDGNTLTDGVNPPNNQFNSTVNTTLPQTTTSWGVDVDTYPIDPYLFPGKNSATTTYSSGGDLVLLSAEIFSVTNVLVADLAITKSHTGNFGVGADEDFTIQVRNQGPSDDSGPITVTDTLPAGLTFVSGTGTGWGCVAVGQDVTCTHAGPLAASAALPDLTLTVAVDAAAAPSVTNTAQVSGNEFDNRPGDNSDSDLVSVVAPDLSGSTKSVVDLNGGTAEPGDVLRYTITLIESAGGSASGVAVTDDVPANVTGFSVVSVPLGATDASTGAGTGANGTGFLDVSGIRVPGGGSETILFDVTIAGGTPPGTVISNAANVTNPNGPGASPAAPDVIVSAGSIPASGVKPLYLRLPSPTLDLSRLPEAGAGNVRLLRTETATWTQNPPTQASLELAAGNIPAVLYLRKGGASASGVARTVQVTLAYTGAATGTIGTDTQNLTLTGTPTPFTFNFSLGSILTLPPGTSLTLAVSNQSPGPQNRPFRVFPQVGGNTSRVLPDANTVINVDSVNAYDAAFPGGVIPPSFLPGATAYVRAVVSDPFGSFDITGATLDIVDPLGTPVLTGVPMPQVASGGATATFELAFPIPGAAPLGTWSLRVVASEGTEGTISHTGTGTFVVAVPAPNLVVLKAVTTLDDPVNGPINPKAIPGANVLYTIRTTNQGAGATDPDSVSVSDTLPPDLELYVADLGGPGSGPVAFADGAPPSGLSYSFGGLGDAADDLEFDDGTLAWSYTPVPDVDGYDPSVTAVRINPTGALAAAGAGNPSFDLLYRMRVR